VATRQDYSFPFAIDPASGQGAQASYPGHVDQMIRQLLLTSLGERACLPEFGCGLRQLVFAGQSDALAATVGLQVRQAINRWMVDQARVQDVIVVAGAAADPSLGLDQGELLITIRYLLVETMTSSELSVKVV
jgi:phage baseplate assembly protein W